MNPTPPPATADSDATEMTPERASTQRRRSRIDSEACGGSEGRGGAEEQTRDFEEPIVEEESSPTVTEKGVESVGSRHTQEAADEAGEAVRATVGAAKQDESHFAGWGRRRGSDRQSGGRQRSRRGYQRGSLSDGSSAYVEHIDGRRRSGREWWHQIPRRAKSPDSCSPMQPPSPPLSNVLADDDSYEQRRIPRSGDVSISEVKSNSANCQGGDNRDAWHGGDGASSPSPCQSHAKKSLDVDPLLRLGEEKNPFFREEEIHSDNANGHGRSSLLRLDEVLPLPPESAIGDSYQPMASGQGRASSLRLDEVLPLPPESAIGDSHQPPSALTAENTWHFLPGAYFIRPSQARTERTSHFRRMENVSTNSSTEIQEEQGTITSLPAFLWTSQRPLPERPPLVDGIAVLVAPDEREDDENEHDGGSCFNAWGRRRLLPLGAAALVVLAATVAVIVSVTKQNNRTQGDLPTSATRGNQREDYLRAIIMESGVSDPEDLSGPVSPQSLALQWMATMDETRADSSMLTVAADAVVQRYILAVLYYSTGGEFWAGADQNESTAKDCDDWEHVCWDTFEGIDMGRGKTNGDSGIVPFLTASKHECEWDGVGCHIGSDIVGAVSLVRNNLTGTLPDELGSLKRLTWLNLLHNDIGGSIPNGLGKLGSSIEVIDLYDNLLTGWLPEMFDSLPSLRHFGFGINSIGGGFPRTLEGHQAIEVFNGQFNGIGGDGIEGTLPSFVASLPSLKRLDLDLNRLVGPIPEGAWSELVNMFVGWNEGLNGTIPASLATAPKLKSVSATSNRLSGTIPPEFFGGNSSSAARCLLGLSLLDNYLTGAIPEEVGDALSLKAFHVDGNALSGPVPSSVGQLKGLWSFGMGHNLLSGHIPVLDLPELRFLLLGGNEFVGTVPENLGHSGHLKLLDVSRTNLTGSLNFLCYPGAPAMAADCGVSVSAGRIVGPEIECDCCQFCCSDNVVGDVEGNILGCGGIILDNRKSMAFTHMMCEAVGWDHVMCGGSFKDDC